MKSTYKRLRLLVHRKYTDLRVRIERRKLDDGTVLKAGNSQAVGFIDERNARSLA